MLGYVIDNAPGYMIGDALRYAMVEVPGYAMGDAWKRAPGCTVDNMCLSL